MLHKTPGRSVAKNELLDPLCQKSNKTGYFEHLRRGKSQNQTKLEKNNTTNGSATSTCRPQPPESKQYNHRVYINRTGCSQQRKSEAIIGLVSSACGLQRLYACDSSRACSCSGQPPAVCMLGLSSSGPPVGVQHSCAQERRTIRFRPKSDE